MSRSMTLMPVSNSSRFGSRVSKSGAGAVDVPPRLDALERVDVEGLAEHVDHVAEHGVAHRHLQAVAEVAHRRATAEAVGRLQADGPDATLADLLGHLGPHDGVDVPRA